MLSVHFIIFILYCPSELRFLFGTTHTKSKIATQSQSTTPLRFHLGSPGYPLTLNQHRAFQCCHCPWICSNRPLCLGRARSLVRLTRRSLSSLVRAWTHHGALPAPPMPCLSIRQAEQDIGRLRPHRFETLSMMTTMASALVRHRRGRDRVMSIARRERPTHPVAPTDCLVATPVSLL